jgi:Ca-activated chloride channel homolog
VRSVLTGLLAAAVVGFVVPSEHIHQRQSEPYTVSVDVDLVLLNVIALDKNGRAVPGLKQANFKVYEDGRLQQLALFAGQDAPATIGLVVDSSASMARRWPEVRRALEAFASESNPSDEMFLIYFSDETQFPLPQDKPFTNDVDVFKEAIGRVRPIGRTALYDAISAGLDYVKNGRFEKKILVILSDGADNASARSFEQILTATQQSSVTVYTIGVYEPEADDRDPKALKRLASATGGEAQFPQNDAEFHATWRRIAAGIRTQYTLAYYPQNSGNRTFRKIKVLVTSAGGMKVSVHARPGYFARTKSENRE